MLTDSTTSDTRGISSADGVLFIGRGLVFSGNIVGARTIIIQGTLKSDHLQALYLIIEPGGVFEGSAEVKCAEINGRFEGKINVMGRLQIQNHGVISGKAVYKTISVQFGGRITGMLEMH